MNGFSQNELLFLCAASRGKVLGELIYGKRITGKDKGLPVPASSEVLRRLIEACSLQTPVGPGLGHGGGSRSKVPSPWFVRCGASGPADVPAGQGIWLSCRHCWQHPWRSIAARLVRHAALRASPSIAGAAAPGVMGGGGGRMPAVGRSRGRADGARRTVRR